jgi:hypothetical protein
MGNWRIKAKRIIQAALREAKAKGIGGRALRRFITKSYPAYGYLDEQGRPIRGKYPYRVWLEELDAVMFRELNGCAQMGLNLGDA